MRNAKLKVKKYVSSLYQFIDIGKASYDDNRYFNSGIPFPSANNLNKLSFI